MRVLVINNLKSGAGGAHLYDFVNELGRNDAEITLRYLNGSRSLKELLADANQFDRVVASGGDGTVSGVCYELRNTGIPVLAYPAGTANLISSNLGLPSNPVTLARIALGDDYTTFDMGEFTHMGSTEELPVDKRCGFMGIAGAGYDAEIMDRAQQLKPTFGMFAYVVGVLQTVVPTYARFKITLDGVGIDSEGIAVLVVNFAKLQFDLAVTHGSDAQDGVFEVAIVRPKSPVGLIPAVWGAVLDRVLGYPARRALDVRPAREILVEADPPLRLQYDGEAPELVTPFGARVLPGAATLFVGFPVAQGDRGDAGSE